MDKIYEFDQFLLNEYGGHYDPEKLYLRSSIVKRLQAGPSYIRAYINKLPEIRCTDSEGNPQICTKIPQVLYQFLFGNF